VPRAELETHETFDIDFPARQSAARLLMPPSRRDPLRQGIRVESRVAIDVARGRATGTSRGERRRPGATRCDHPACRPRASGARTDRRRRPDRPAGGDPDRPAGGDSDRQGGGEPGTDRPRRPGRPAGRRPGTPAAATRNRRPAETRTTDGGETDDAFWLDVLAGSRCHRRVFELR